ncbi:uncharacterized protein [Aristolochia californica]|uniref:uncharacterized protein n=1 Tax=Aristolochia californica TaxID=171875 RepID=UPI0035D694D3
MAVSLEGFSIREYAVKMRRTDVRKSWPFGESESDPQRAEIENLLPPMICRKHVWWSEELEAVKLKQSEDLAKEKSGTSEKETRLQKEDKRIDEVETVVGNFELDEEAVLKVCPVCENFSASTINAMNAHVDSCLAKASKEEKRQMRLARAKSKTPKKRSIVEIFAVSPQVETVEEVQDRLNSESEEKSDLDVLMPKKRRNKKLMTGKKKMELKRRNQMLKKTLSKEKFRKLKLPCGLDISRLTKGSSHNKGRGRKSAGIIGRRKKMSSKLNNQCQKNLKKMNLASKLINQGKDFVIAKSSTQKNKMEITASHKLLTKSILKGANSSRMSHSNRHVKFSGNDDIIGHSQKFFSALELPQIQTLSEVFPNIVSQSLESVESLPDMDNGPGRNSNIGNVEVNISDARDFRSLSEKNQSGGIYSNVRPLSFGDSVDLNQTFQSHDRLQLFNPSSSALSLNVSCSANSKLPNPVLGEHKAVSNAEALESSAFWRSVSTRKQLDCIGSSISNSSSAISLEPKARNAFSQSSLSSLVRYMDTNEKQPSTNSVEHTSNSCSLPYPPWLHVAPKDLMSGLYSPLDVKENLAYRGMMQNGEPRLGSTPVSLFRENSFDEDIIGLPLNSQGELIQLHSNNKLRFNQLFRKQSAKNGSAGCFLMNNQMEPLSVMALSDMREKLDGRAHVVGQKPLKYTVPAHSGLGVTNLQSFGRPESMYRELNLINISAQGLGEDNKHHEKINVSKTVQERGNADACSQPTQHPTVRLMGKNVTLGRNNSEGQLLDGTTWIGKEEIFTEHFPPAVNFSQSFMPRQHTPSVSRISNESGSNSIDAQRTPNPDSPTFFQVRTVRPNFSHTFMNCIPHQMARNCLQATNDNVCSELQHRIPWKLSENCASGTNSVRMGHENQRAMTYKQNHPQSIVHEFPFPNCKRQDFHQDVPQCSSPSLPRWLQAATQQKQTPITSSSQPLQSFTKQKQMLTSGAKFPSFHAPYISSNVSFHSHASSTSLSSSQTSCIIHGLSPFPAVPGLKHVHRSGFRNERETELLADGGGADHTKVIKKRPASKTNDSRKSSKKPNLRVQEVSESAAELNRRIDLECEQYDAGAYRGQNMDLSIYELESERGLENSSGTKSSKLDNISRLGPTKLSAGAKHILKPSQNIDEDNSRPIHATIPFAGITGSGKLPEFQKKTAQIYRF